MHDEKMARKLAWLAGMAVLVAAVVVPPRPAPVEAQISSAEVRCRRALHSGAQRYLRTIIGKQVTCHRMRMEGKLSPLRNCNDPDRLPSGLILGVLQTHLQRRAFNACKGTPASFGYEQCEAPCGNIVLRTFADVGRCHACLVKNEARVISQNMFATPQVFGGKTREVRCQTAMGEEHLRYLTSLLFSHQRCQFLQDRGAIPGIIDCRRFDFLGMFARARSVVQRRLTQLCTSTPSETLTGCGGAAGGNHFRCITQQAESSADLLFRIVYLDRDRASKVAFVTSQTWSGGEIGGVEGADAICQATAQDTMPPLRGEYRAWISDDSGSPATRFNPATAPYFLLTTGMIAESFQSLVETHPLIAIDTDESSKKVIFESPVWTGTTGTGAAAGDGAAAANCNGWTSNEGTGVVGLPYYIGGGLWTQSSTAACSQRGHLYCFQQ